MIELDSDNSEAVDLDNLDKNFGDSQPKTATKKFEKTNYFTLKNGNNVLRIMPPMFSCLETGHWSVYYAKHFGYFNDDGTPVNYICIREYDNQTGGIAQDCPFCVDQEKKKKAVENWAAKVNLLQNQLHEVTVAGDAEAQDTLTAELESATDEHRRAKAMYNSRNAKFWVNAMNKNGEFGIVGLPKTIYEQLVGKKLPDKVNAQKYTRTQGLLQKVKEKHKFDAMAVNEGVWFNVVREGTTQMDTRYTIQLEEEEVELPSGDIVNRVQKAPLSEQQKRDALTKCKDLQKVFNHLILTPEQAETITNGSGKAVRAVNNAPRTVEVSETVQTPRAAVAAAAPAKSNQDLLNKFKKLK
jgi:hypothetical protein